MMLTKEGRKFITLNKIESYTIALDRTVNVGGIVKINTKQSKFPVKFDKVTYYFECGHCQLVRIF